MGSWRYGPQSGWPDRVKQIWLAVFDYANEDCGATKRQARNIADATVESIDTNITIFGPTGRRLLRKAPRRVKQSKHKKEVQ
jgi:hypothetical protein